MIRKILLCLIGWVALATDTTAQEESGGGALAYSRSPVDNPLKGLVPYAKNRVGVCGVTKEFSDSDGKRGDCWFMAQQSHINDCLASDFFTASEVRIFVIKAANLSFTKNKSHRRPVALSRCLIPTGRLWPVYVNAWI